MERKWEILESKFESIWDKLLHKIVFVVSEIRQRIHNKVINEVKVTKFLIVRQSFN